MNQMPRYRITGYVDASQKGIRMECVRCGAHISHMYEVTDTESGDVLYPLGVDCVKRVTGMTPARLASEWRQYEEEEEPNARGSDPDAAMRIREWQVVNQATLDALEKLAVGEEHYAPVAEDLVGKIVKYGTLTEKQLAFAKRLIEKTERLCSREEFEKIDHISYVYSSCVKMNMYDTKFVDDLCNFSQYGVTKAQMNTLLGLSKKYRGQLLKNREKFESARGYEVIQL